MPLKLLKSKGKKRIDIILSVILVLALLVWLFSNIIYNRTNYKVEFYQVASSKLSSGARMIFISDLHLREYGKDNELLAAEIENLDPDIIVLGGDMVNSKKDNYDNMLSFCEKIARISPVYAVLGNHEDVKIFMGNDTELVKRFSDAGVHILRNSTEEIVINDNVVRLIGIEGNSGNFEKYGAKDIMEKCENEGSNDFTVCIAHVPILFPERLANYSFDLGLSGHVHGGIVRLPKLGALYSAEEGFFPDYSAGEYTLKNGAKLIVSRGLGDSGFALRINNTPEISVIDLI